MKKQHILLSCVLLFCFSVVGFAQTMKGGGQYRPHRNWLKQDRVQAPRNGLVREYGLYNWDTVKDGSGDRVYRWFDTSGNSAHGVKSTLVYMASVDGMGRVNFLAGAQGQQGVVFPALPGHNVASYSFAMGFAEVPVGWLSPVSDSEYSNSGTVYFFRQRNDPKSIFMYTDVGDLDIHVTLSDTEAYASGAYNVLAGSAYRTATGSQSVLYFNGRHVASKSSTTFVPESRTMTGVGSERGYSGWFNMLWFRIYNRVLTDEELRESVRWQP